MKLRGTLQQPYPSYTSCVNLFLVTLLEFRDSLLRDEPPRDLNRALAALWWDAKGDWTRAHDSAQQDEGPAGAWVHGYLHRKEGDASNAGYWYQRAGKTPAQRSLEEEWLDITESLLK
jgi:hypothetical protein